jgi:tRNA dimethylallyltransferase
MVPQSPLTKLVCFVGPTASGKSRLALELAQSFNAEIVNADSRQFYRELHIGTAKPEPQELGLIPHHLVNSASLESPWDVGDFIRHARLAIDDIVKRGKRVFVVGGTGLYVRHLLFGLAEIPAIPETLRQDLQLRFKKEGLPSLYQELAKRDPGGAERLKAGDTQRILRALEVVMHTGKPLTDFWPENKAPLYESLQIAIHKERDALYRDIDARVVTMFERGLKKEAQTLFEAYPDNVILNKTIGYAEWAKLGFENDARVLEDIQKNSRHFAKRQLTWFRREMNVHWLQDETFEGLKKTAQDLISSF